MNRRLLLALALSLFAPAASATGQEMAGLAVYLAAGVSLLVGGALGLAVAIVVLLIGWGRGALRRHPVRMAFASVGIIAAGPIVVFLGFVVNATIDDIRKYPLQYAWLTGAETPEAVQQPPPAPSTGIVTTTRDRLGVLVQDIVRWWYYDPDVEDAERRASQPQN